VFGNALLQERTARYVASKRGGLIDLVCNGRGPEPLASVLDLSLLKVGASDASVEGECGRACTFCLYLMPVLQHRQRDDIEESLQGYAETVPFDMAGLRDQRCAADQRPF
jgi:hypothetical protein